MSFKDDILEEVQVGNIVTLDYSGQSITGKVLKLTENMIHVQGADRSPRIALDSVTSFDILPEDTVVTAAAPPAPAPAPVPAPAPKIIQPVIKVETGHAMADLRAELKGQETAPLTAEEAAALLAALLREHKEEGLPAAEIHSVLASMKNAVHNHSLPEKLHDLRVKVNRLYQDAEGEAAIRAAILLMATLELSGGGFQNAADYFEAAGSYQLAARASALADNTDGSDALILRAALNGECLCPAGVKLLADFCERRRNVSVLLRAVRLEPDPKALHSLLQCAALLAGRRAIEMIADVYTSEAALLEAFCGLMPSEDWRALAPEVREAEQALAFAQQEADRRAAPADPLPTGPRVSTIRKYLPEKRIGFLNAFYDKREGDPQRNVLFYIAQVEDEDPLLRYALAHEAYQNLEVSYEIGLNFQDQASVTNMRLTEAGRAQAKRNLNPLSRDQLLPGTLLFYRKDQDWGRVEGRDGERYSFKSNALDDPWLSALCLDSFEPVNDLDVLFSLEPLPDGKLVARHVLFASPLSAQEIEQRGLTVSPAELEHWNDLQKLLDRPAPEISEPYPDKPYTDLPPLTEEAVSAAPVLRRPPLSSLLKKHAPAEKPAAGTEAVPAPLPASAPVREPQAPPPAVSHYYDRAHNASTHGRLEEAERLYKLALENKEKLESSVPDLICLYNRMPNRWEDAAQVLKQYRAVLPEDKALNLAVQIYQKGKTPQAREELCSVLEQAIRRTSKVTSKVHYMVQRAQTQTLLGHYQAALETYRSWRDLYSQYRSTPDGLKLSRMLQSIQKGEAVCYYHLGNRDQAEELAKGVLRLNPMDETASAILNGTLTVDAHSDAIPENLLPDEDEDEDEGADRRLSRFVQSCVHGVDLTLAAKNLHVVNGHYAGTPEQARRDIDSLIRVRRASPKNRSEAYFAAARIVEECLDNSEGENSQQLLENRITRHRLVRDASQAIIEWGDYMVSMVCDQLDTPRFAYLSGIGNLRPKNQSFVNAFNRYLRSYYVGQSELQEYIHTQNSSSSQDGLQYDIFSRFSLPEALYPEFLVGILRLLRTLNLTGIVPLQRVGSNLQQGMFSSSLRQGLLRQLGLLLGQELPQQDCTKDEFIRLLGSAQKVIEEKERQLAQSLNDSATYILGSQDQEHGLQPKDWECYIDSTDFARLTKIASILHRARDYHNGMDFEHRADCLKDTLQQIDTLNQEIRERPTQLSYDVYQPALDRMRTQLADQQSDMYRALPPMVSWEETTQPHYDSNGTVRVYLTVKNENNRQTADTIEYSVVQNSDVLAWRPEDSCESGTVSGLRGGSSAEIILILSLSPQAREVGSFTLDLRYSYRYNRTAQEFTESEQMPVEMTCVLRTGDSRPLENPYTGNVGNPMHDVKMFKGRDNELNKILEMICPMETTSAGPSYGHGLAIYGQTRTGKSSLLYHLKRRLRELPYANHAIVWDMQNIGEMQVDGGDILVTFLYKLLNVADEELARHPELARQTAAAQLENPAEKILQNPAYAAAIFTNYMRRLDQIVRCQSGGMVVVLLIDEFTYLHGKIREGRISPDFMRFWKALLQNYCLFAVLAGQDDMPAFINEYKNEFACMELMKITYLNEVAAKELICDPLIQANGLTEKPFTDKAVDMIYQQTAGSAYLIILLCANLVDYMNECGAHTASEAIVRSFLRTKAFGRNSFLGPDIFEPQMQERGRREKDEEIEQILLAIARLSRTTGQASLRELRAALPQVEYLGMELGRLVQRNVLQQIGSDAWRIEVKLLERWLLETRGEQ